ncbi:MAG TPA: hypothetical protein VGN52_20030 [Burkholderiales bacterium]
MKTLHLFAAAPLIALACAAHAQTGAGSGSGNASSTSAGFNSSTNAKLPAAVSPQHARKQKERATGDTSLAASGEADLKRGADRARTQTRVNNAGGATGTLGAGTGSMGSTGGPGGIGGTR